MAENIIATVGFKVDTSDLKSVERELDRIRSKSASLKQSGGPNGIIQRALLSADGGKAAIASLGSIAAGVTAIASLPVVGLAAIASKIDDIGDAAAKAQLSVEDFSKLKFVASRSDTELSTLTKNYQRLIVEIGKGGDKLRDFGIDIKDSNGNIRPSLEILSELADKTKQYGNTAETSAKLVAIFGKSGQDMLPFLIQGSERIDELSSKAESLGLIINTRTATAAGALTDKVSLLSQIMAGFGNSIADNVLPKLQELTKDTSGLEQSLATISTGTGKFAGVLTNAFILVETTITSIVRVIALAIADVTATIGNGIDNVSDIIEKRSLKIKSAANVAKLLLFGNDSEAAAAAAEADRQIKIIEERSRARDRLFKASNKGNFIAGLQQIADDAKAALNIVLNGNQPLIDESKKPKVPVVPTKPSVRSFEALPKASIPVLGQDADRRLEALRVTLLGFNSAEAIKAANTVDGILSPKILSQTSEQVISTFKTVSQQIRDIVAEANAGLSEFGLTAPIPSDNLSNLDSTIEKYNELISKVDELASKQTDSAKKDRLVELSNRLAVARAGGIALRDNNSAFLNANDVLTASKLADQLDKINDNVENEKSIQARLLGIETRNSAELAVQARTRRAIEELERSGVELSDDQKEQIKQANVELEKRIGITQRILGENRALTELADDIGQSIGDSLESNIARALSGSKSAFKDFLSDLSNILISSGIRSLFQSLFKVNASGGATGGLGGLFGSIISGLFVKNVSAAAGAANGGVFDGSNATFFANGGVFNTPTQFKFGNNQNGVLGEAGPEAVIPLTRKNGKLGIAGGVNTTRNFQMAGTLNIIINSSGNDPQKDQETARSFDNLLRSRFAAFIADQQRSGGQLNPVLVF